MASYIYSIRPDDNNFKNLEKDNGVVVWHIPTSSDKIFSGDEIYLYITDEKKSKKMGNETIFSGSRRLEYKAIVLEVLYTYKERQSKKELKLFIKELSLKSSSKLKFDMLNKNGMSHPPQSYPLDLQEVKYKTLLTYIKDNEDYPETYEEKVINDVQKVNHVFYKKYSTKSNGSANKLSGSLMSSIIEKQICSVLNNNYIHYKKSEQNSFVLGFPTEWDLIILKENATKVSNLNVYKADDVIAVLEFKKRGIIVTKERSIDKVFENIINSVQNMCKINSDIKFAYITYHESTNPKKVTSYDYLKESVNCLKILGENNVFCFTTKGVAMHSNFRDFIVNLVK